MARHPAPAVATAPIIIPGVIIVENCVEQNKSTKCYGSRDNRVTHHIVGILGDVWIRLGHINNFRIGRLNNNGFGLRNFVLNDLNGLGFAADKRA